MPFSAHISFAFFLAIPAPIMYPLAVAFVLGVLVFVHEFGHYAVAKLCKVRVEVFSLGFGKRLWGFRRGETDYRLSLLPLGGYVKMSGENPMEDRTGDPGEFMSHPRWQRFLIAIAGPAMNILLALAVLTGLYMVHHDYNAVLHAPVDVVWVTPDSSAAKAGIQRGDRIIAIQDAQNPDWKKLLEAEMIPNQPLNVVLQRGDAKVDVKLTAEAKGTDQIGDVGLELPEVVGWLEPGGPAEKAGVKVNDVLVSLDGKDIRSIGDMLNQLQTTKGKPVQLTVLRDGMEQTINVTPVIMADKFRVGLRPNHVEKLGFQAALGQSYVDCRENSLLIFKLVGGMLQKKVSIKQMSGPIGIMKISGEAASIGWAPLLYVMALISINLAIFNLFPIPILDGGLMLMLLIESIMRRDINQQIKERAYQAAFVVLILFAAVVIFNDLAKSFHG
jgi:regulator of sigma E protease